MWFVIYFSGSVIRVFGKIDILKILSILWDRNIFWYDCIFFDINELIINMCFKML